jgi:acetoin utilization protein AcuB
MRVQDVMTRRVETVSADDPAADALERMRQRRIRHLVVTLNHEIAGVLSSRDLVSLPLSEGAPLVRDLMTSPAVSIEPDATLRQAANLLRGRSIGCLPVLEGKKLVGILTTTDLLELIGRGAERPIARGKRWILKDRGQRPRRRAGR